VCKVVKKEHERGRTAETMCWLDQGEEPAVKIIILDDDVAIKRAAKRWVMEKEAKVGAGVWMWWTDGSQTDDGRVEPQRCASAETAGQSSAAS
jgi:hypothetical protein